MTHDPLCPATTDEWTRTHHVGCQCLLINRVRTNERERIAADLAHYRARYGPAHAAYDNAYAHAIEIAQGAP